MPLPTGVVRGRLMATRFLGIDSRTWGGIGSPYFSITSRPASWASHSMSAPDAAPTPRPLGRAGQRGDAPADPRGPGPPPLAPLPRALAHAGELRRSLPRRGAQGVGGPGLPTARGGPLARRGAARGEWLAGGRGRSAAAARGRALHSPRAPLPCLRPPRGPRPRPRSRAGGRP